MMVATSDRRRYSHTGSNMIDLVHTGPGTLAGRYIRSFWQPVFHSEDLEPGDAKPIRIMSQDYTLYRGDSGTPYMIDFRCAHRQTQLSTGWVEGEDIRCIYHGWMYNGQGQCVQQPAEERPFCEKVKLGGYPCRDYLGLVFAYMGEGEPPAFPRYPTVEPGTFEGFLEMDTYGRACNFFQHLDNDAAHVAFVHRGAPGSMPFDDHPVHVEAWETGWGYAVKSTRPSGRGSTVQHGMPNMIHAKVHPIEPDLLNHREFIVWVVPVDDENMIQFNVNVVRLPKEKHEEYRRRRAATLARQSIPKEELVDPILSGKLRRRDVPWDKTDMIRLQDDISIIAQGRITDRSKEMLGGTDVDVILLRRLWTRELQALEEGRPLKQWVYNPDEVTMERNAE